MERAVLFYKPYAAGPRIVLGIVEDVMQLNQESVDNLFKNIPIQTDSNWETKPSLMMGYGNFEYVLKEGGEVNDTNNGKSSQC